jgi:hypothetical protein
MIIAVLAVTHATRKLLSVCRLRKMMREQTMVTRAEIRATAKSLCFRACTDCKSADECDPDDNWMEEAQAALEVDGPDQIANPRSNK